MIESTNAKKYLLILLIVFVASTSAVDYSNRSTFGVPSPLSALPIRAKMHDLLDNESEFHEYYTRALQACNSKLDIVRKQSPNLISKEISLAAADLFQKLGILLWGFGPDTCSLFRKCWFGVLTCGQVQELQIQVQYNSSISKLPASLAIQYPVTLENVPEYLGWSLRALHVHTIINGTETLTPRTHVVSFITKKKGGNGIGSMSEALVGTYVLTIPGTYYIDSRIHAFYPGSLHAFNMTQRAKCMDLQHLIVFGTIQNRNPPSGMNILTPDTRRVIKAEADFDSDGQHDSTPLPYCTNGNHPGRWINIPPVVLQTCKTPRHTNTRSRVSETAIARKYYYEVSRMDSASVWASLFQGNTSVGTGEANQIMTREEFKLFQHELHRYANGNLCSLVDVERDPHFNTRLSVYAPYDCRYKIFDRNTATQCLSDVSRRHMTLHGDSVARMIHMELGELLGLAVETEEQLKNRINPDTVAGLTTVDTFGSKDSNIHIDAMFQWYPTEKPWTIQRSQKNPFSFMSNFAFHHLEFVDMEAFRQKSFNSSFYEFWSSRANPNQSPSIWNPRMKIYQAPPFLFNDLNHWQNNEAYRRRAVVLKSMFMSLGFDLEIDQYLLNSGHLSYDYHYRGVPKKMATMILLNLYCHNSSI